MIRELTKSAVSFSWALSLLALKQATNLGKSAQQNGGDLFSPVTHVAVGQLDDSIKGIFRSGDNVQSRMVDVAFSWMNPVNWFNPANWNLARPMGNCGQTTVDSNSQARPQPSGQPAVPVESPAFWMNPLNWLNPANVVRSMGNWSPPSAGPSSGQAGSNPGISGSQPGWGPM